MRAYQQTKEQHREFLNAIIKKYELIAPVKTDVSRFEPIKDTSKIWLEAQTYEPAKKYFFPQRETLFTFNGMKLTPVKPNHRKRAIYGMRRCDLNAVLKQDNVFLKDAHDPYYSRMREDTWLLGYHCNTAPSEYCFCGSMQLKDHFDLMFYDKQDHFLVEVGSESGQTLLNEFRIHFEVSTRHITQEDKYIPGADRLKRNEITTLYDNPDWKKGVDLCLSCGACTTLCPTCYCFGIHDEINAKNPETGTRNREWSSCQVPEFTKVAGDHVFRNKRDERFKHRIYHQLDYYKKKYGEDLCVGCSRCISGCPTRIDFVQIINEMEDGKPKN